MKHRHLKTLTIVALLGMGLTTTQADDIDALLNNVKKNVDEKNYSKALEEMTWLHKEIEKLNSGSIADLLPDTLDDLKGAEPEIESAMGITSIKKLYEGDATTLELTLTQMGGGSGLSGIAGLGALAALAGNSQNAVRISGKTAQIQPMGQSTKMMIYLNGAMLELLINKKSADLRLKGLAELLPLDKIENYMRGVQ